MNIAIRAFVVVLVMCYGYIEGLSAQTSEIPSDRAHRDTAIRWPPAYDPSVAPVFSHNELLIHTDCHRTFAQLADVTAWPNWLVIVTDVANETTGRTGQGALYRLKIFGSPTQSRIVEFEADQRISWIPFGADETEITTAITTPGISFRRVQIASSLRKRPASDPEIARIPPLEVTTCTKHTNYG